MKGKLTILKLLVVLCSAFVATAVLGQTTYTWTGAADQTNLAVAGNWTTNGVDPATTLPHGSFLDTAQWDGVTKSNLVLSYDSPGFIVPYPPVLGTHLVLTANQTNSVQIISPVPFPTQYLNGSNITNSSPSAAFVLGDNTANNLRFITRPTGAIHYFVNNSTAASTIHPNVEWLAGGTLGSTYDFSGTGNWIVNSYLMPDNSAVSPSTVQVDGPGMVFWSAGAAGSYVPNSVLSNIVINGGALVLKSAFPGNSDQLRNAPIANSTTLTYAPVNPDSQSLNGVISGTGSLVVSNGTLTLGGANTYAGGTTIGGGTLQVGTNGTSGSLGSGNVANDGSLIFNRSDNVTITNLISGVGSVVKQGSGTLTLAGTTNAYTGLTTVSSGVLVLQAKTGSGDITVADGTRLSVTGTTQITPGTLTVGTGAGATLEFNNINSTTTAIIAAGTLSSAGTLTVRIRNSNLLPGVSYPLLTWTSGSAPTVALGLVGFEIGDLRLQLSISGNTLYVSIKPQVVYTWTNAPGGDLATATNWTPNGAPSGQDSFGDIARWDGVAAGPLNITKDDTSFLLGVLFKSFGIGLVFTANQVSPVNFTSSASVGSVQIAINNISIASGAGAVTFGNPAGPGPGNTYLFNIVTRPSGTVHNFLNNSANAATINGDVRWLAGAGVAYTLDFDGTGNWVVNNYLVSDNGGQGVLIQKDGSGTMTWNPTGYLGSDAFNSTAISVNSGALVLAGSHPRLGSRAITNNSTFQFNAPAQSQTLSGVISGSGLLKVSNGTLVLSGENTYTGGTTISGGTLQVGTNGASGSLGSGNVTNNGVLVFNRSDDVSFGNVISGTGSVVKLGAGALLLNGVNTYAGSTTVSNGTLGGTGTLSGPVTLKTGTTLAPGASVGTLTISNNLNIGGNVAIEVDKTLSQSNDFVAVSGVLTNTGTGTLTVSNLGPALVAGDKFTLFSKPLSNGLALTVSGGNATWTNNLAVDGSISVIIGPPVLNFTNTGSGLQFSWTGTFKLQSQTNSLNVGVSTNWGDYPGGGTSGVTVPVEATRETVFFRLVSP